MTENCPVLARVYVMWLGAGWGDKGEGSCCIREERACSYRGERILKERV